MKAVVISRPGGPEVLEIREVAQPVAGPEEVLVRVKATALNRADLLQRRGRYPAPPGSPADIPGLEFAGEIEQCGERVSGFRRGDRVMGILGGGGYAQRVALHERLCLGVPPAMGWAEAAAIPEAFLTAYDALFASGRLAPGEVVLLHAAASGVGTAAAQLALVSGAQVIALSRSEQKRRRLAELGLLQVFDPREEDLAENIRLACGARGVNLVLDLVGATAWELNRQVLAERGRVVVIGLLGGSRCEIDLSRLMRGRWTIKGSVLRTRPLEEKILLVQEFAARVLPLFAEGRLRPQIDRRLAWSEVVQAHAAMERNVNFGKIVLEID